MKNKPREIAIQERLYNSVYDLALFFFVTFISYLCYLLTAFPTVTTEDSGEFTAAIYHLGIAHPSGYPLYIILGKIFTFLIPFGNVAWKANIFSAFCSALTIGLLYFVIQKITKNKSIAVGVSLFFAGGGLFWSQAIRAEVYGLNSTLMLLIMLLSYFWYEKIQESDFRAAKTLLLWVAFLYGLSIGNHHLMLMMGPPLALFIVLVYPRIFADIRNLTKAISLFLLGLSMYLFLPIRASYQPVINWGNPVTWQSFWAHVTRKMYSVDQINALYQPISSARPSFSLSDFIVDQFNFIQNFFFILNEQYSFLIAILAIFGFIYAWKYSKKIFIFLLSLFFFYSFILSIFIGLGDRHKLPLALFTERPFYISLLLLTILLAGLGMQHFVDIVIKKKTFSPVLKKIVFTISFFISSVWLLTQVPHNNQSDNYMAHDIAKNALASLPSNAVLHSENGDNTLFPILYLQKVENFRPDIKIYMNMPESIYPYFENLENMENENPGKPLFTDFPFVYYPGKTYDFKETFSQIVPDQNQSPTENANQNPPGSSPRTPYEKAIRGFDKSNLDHFHLYLKARFYLDQALATTDSTTQQQLFEKAFHTAPESQNITGQLIGNYLLLAKKYTQSIPYLQRAHEFMPQEYSINFQLILAFIMTNQFDNAQNHLTNIPTTQKDLLLKELKTLSTRPDYQKIQNFLSE